MSTRESQEPMRQRGSGSEHPNGHGNEDESERENTVNNNKKRGVVESMRAAFWTRRKHKFIVVIFVFVVFEVVLVAALGLFRPPRAVSPTVDLGYSRYRGNEEGSDIFAWRGMRYAAPPVDDLRFAAPQDPIATTKLVEASKNGKYCMAVGDKPPIRPATSEDCLFINVYAPTHVTDESKLPVFFFIQGGGFANNANANYDGHGLIRASNYSIVVVTFNYRVGPYGFLAGKDVESANNGLKDQRKALAWVQKHINKFGGNPGHVVLGGDSAGATSITYHLSAYGGRNDKLFHAAAAESPSFATMLTSNETQYQYDALVNAAGCADSSSSLTCLRSLSTVQLQQVNVRYPYPGHRDPPVFSWNPVIDGDLIQDYTYRAFNVGKFINVPTIFGDDTNAGTVFTPRDTATVEESDRFIHNTFPYLTERQFENLDELYKNEASVKFPDSGAYWRRTSDAYGEMRYMCPNLFLSSAFVGHNAKAGVKTWNYRYNVQDPSQLEDGLGVPHVVELNAIFGPGNTGDDASPQSYHAGQSNAAIVPLMQAYWTSFVRTFDPNSHRLAGAPEWVNWQATAALVAGSNNSSTWQVETSGSQQRMLLDTPVSASKMEEVGAEQWDRCKYLWSIGLDIRQ